MPLLRRREEDVVRLVADGLKNREIAQRLKVKEHSIRNYIYRIFEKLGGSSRVELILVCIQPAGARQLVWPVSNRRFAQVM
jgi:DNA-binding NarL/FixJ family response regulator